MILALHNSETSEIQRRACDPGPSGNRVTRVLSVNALTPWQPPSSVLPTESSREGGESMADRMTLSSTPVIKVSAPTNTWEVAISAALLLQTVQAPKANWARTSTSQKPAAERTGAASCRRRRILSATEVRPTTINNSPDSMNVLQ